MPLASPFTVGTTAVVIRGHGQRLSISFLFQSTGTNTLYVMIELGGRTISSSVFDYALLAGASVSFNLFTHGPYTTYPFNLLASATTVTVGVGETFSQGAQNV